DGNRAQLPRSAGALMLRILATVVTVMFGGAAVAAGLPPAVAKLIEEAQGVGIKMAPGGLTVASGEVRPDQLLVSSIVRHNRVGVTSPLVAVPAWLGPITLSAGTPVYAQIFSSLGGGPVSPGMQVGWCAPSFQRLSDTPVSQAICFFRQGDAGLFMPSAKSDS